LCSRTPSFSSSNARVAFLQSFFSQSDYRSLQYGQVELLPPLGTLGTYGISPSYIKNYQGTIEPNPEPLLQSALSPTCTRIKGAGMNSTFVHLDEDSKKAQEAEQVGCVLPAMPCQFRRQDSEYSSPHPLRRTTTLSEKPQYPSSGSSKLPALPAVRPESEVKFWKASAVPLLSSAKLNSGANFNRGHSFKRAADRRSLSKAGQVALKCTARGDNTPKIHR